MGHTYDNKGCFMLQHDVMNLSFVPVNTSKKKNSGSSTIFFFRLEEGFDWKRHLWIQIIHLQTKAPQGMRGLSCLCRSKGLSCLSMLVTFLWAKMSSCYEVRNPHWPLHPKPSYCLFCSWFWFKSCHKSDIFEYCHLVKPLVECCSTWIFHNL